MSGMSKKQLNQCRQRLLRIVVELKLPWTHLFEVPKKLHLDESLSAINLAWKLDKRILIASEVANTFTSFESFTLVGLESTISTSHLLLQSTPPILTRLGLSLVNSSRLNFKKNLLKVDAIFLAFST